MKKLIVITVLVLINATITWADSSLCSEIAKTANSVMQLRQLNDSFSEILNVLESDPLISEEELSLVKKMLLDAYSSPLYMVEDHKNQAVMEFENKWFIRCLKTLEQEEGK